MYECQNEEINFSRSTRLFCICCAVDSGEIEAMKLAKIKECCAKSVEQAAGDAGRDATDGAPTAARDEVRPTTAPASAGSTYSAPPLASARARTGAAAASKQQVSPNKPTAATASSSSIGIECCPLSHL